MDEPPEEAPNGSLNHEDTDQSPNNQKIYTGGADQAPHKGSEHSGVGSPEQTSDKASNQADNEESRQTDQRTSEEASQPSDYTASQLVDRRSSDHTERKTLESPNQQLTSPLEGISSEKIDDQVSLLSGEKASEQTDQGTLEYSDQTSSDQAEYRTLGKGQHLVYNGADFLPEDYTYQHRFSENEGMSHGSVNYEAETQDDYRSYYKTLAQAENLSLSEIGDNKEVKEADFKIKPCTFEDSQADLRSKVSTAGETESATTIQAYTLPDTDLINDSQSSYEKLPSITTKVYYSSSQDRVQTTEVTTSLSKERVLRDPVNRIGGGFLPSFLKTLTTWHSATWKSITFFRYSSRSLRT